MARCKQCGEYFKQHRCEDYTKLREDSTMWRELAPLHERQSVLIQHREGKWEESWSWAQKLLAQEKYFETIENTYEKQEDCNKYCFKKKNIAQAVTSSNWFCLCWNWLRLAQTGSTSLLKLDVTSLNWFYLIVETGWDQFKFGLSVWRNCLWAVPTGSASLLKLAAIS